MRYLIFEYQYGGHFNEYIRHLLTYAVNKCPHDSITLVLPKNYKKHFDNGELPLNGNIVVDYLTEDQVLKCKKKGRASTFIASYYRSGLVARYIAKYNVDKTILLTAINYLFWVWARIPRNAKIELIEYIIPRRREKKTTIAKRLYDNLRMWFVAHTPQIKRLYLLNDDESANYYNTDFHTSKFRFLPDPIDCINSNITTEHENKIILLHAGRFRREKGTFEIIKALKSLSNEERCHFKFVLCGSSPVQADNDLTKKEMAELSEMMDVEFYNSFVDESFLHAQYSRADYILIPYQNFAQSSGNLGHAASYKKPVIGPEQGLLGFLIRKYHLGYTLDSLDAHGITKALRLILSGKSNEKYLFEQYTNRCSPDDFAKILLIN